MRGNRWCRNLSKRAGRAVRNPDLVNLLAGFVDGEGFVRRTFRPVGKFEVVGVGMVRSAGMGMEARTRPRAVTAFFCGEAAELPAEGSDRGRDARADRGGHRNG